MRDSELLHEIEPQLEQAYEDHMFAIRDKHSHDPVATKRPFSPVTQLAEVAGTEEDPLIYGPVLRDDYDTHIKNFEETYGVDIKPVLAAAFLVNLLTEDNLPHYTSRIHSKGAGSEALMLFANEWTAEEDAHGVIMRDFALLTGLIGSRDISLISHVDYDTGRVSQLRAGTEIDPPTLQHAFAYLPLQEHLTKEAHKKLGWVLPPMGRRVMNPIAGDEQNHYEYYFKAAKASLDVDPDGALITMNQVYGSFSMPGALGIPEFDDRSITIGLSGIFDLETIAQSKQTIIKKLEVENADPSTDTAKEAQESLLKETSDRSVKRQRKLMERLRDSAFKDQTSGITPFILGKTIDLAYKGAPGHERPIGLIPVSI